MTGGAFRQAPDSFVEAAKSFAGPLGRWQHQGDHQRQFGCRAGLKMFSGCSLGGAGG